MGLKSDKLCLECETPLIGNIDKSFAMTCVEILQQFTQQRCQ